MHLMMSRRVRRALLALPLFVVATAATTACDIAMADLKQKETAEWRKTYDVKAGGRLEISNVNGRIEVEPAAGESIEVVAEKSVRAASAEAAKDALSRIEIHETVSADDVRIETKLQKRTGILGGLSQEVHYRVKVPPALEVRVTTVNGGIEVNGLKGRVTAETTNGGIEVDLARVAESGAKLGCTNGGITLTLPSDAKASISARITNGGINTSGVTIETTGENSRRHLEGRMNGGGPRIDIEGTNGGIRIASR